MRRHSLPVAATAAALLACAPAGAAVTATPLDLLTVSGTHATTAQQRTCSSRPLARGARGADVRTLTVPVTGYLEARLTGTPDGPDWDLAIFDATSGARLGASAAFGAAELARAPVAAGQRLVVQACRQTGASDRAPGLTVRDIVLEGSPATPRTLSLVTIRFTRPAQLDALAREGIDLNETARGHTIDAVLHGPKDAAKVRASGLRYTVRVPDPAAAGRRAGAPTAAAAAASELPSGRTTYRQLVDYQNDMKALVRAHPSRVRPVVIGRTVEGRTIEGVEIADHVEATTDGRPTHVEMGLHHAREWSSGEVSMEYAIDLVEHRTSNRTFARLLRTERTFVFPVINVDGFVASMSSGGYDPVADDGTGRLTEGPAASDEGAYKRKNCQNLQRDVTADPVPCASRTGGVDLNRNYGAFWGGPGTSDDPLSAIYRGPVPFSEPETQAVHAWSSHHQVMVLNSNHNYAGDVLFQPGFNRSDEPGLKRGTTVPQAKQMKAIADAMAEAEGYVSEVSYKLYDVTGATEDWNYFSQSTFGFTTELGYDDFHVDYQDAVIDQYLGHADGPLDRAAHRRTSRGARVAMMIAGSAAANPAYHAVIRGTAKAGALLTLSKRFTTSTSNVEAQTDSADTAGAPRTIQEHLTSSLRVPRSGRFTWHVNPSTRPVALLSGKREAWMLRCGGHTHRVVVGMAGSVRLHLGC